MLDRTTRPPTGLTAHPFCLYLARYCVPRHSNDINQRVRAGALWVLVLRGRAQIVQAEDERDTTTEADRRMNDDVINTKCLFVLSIMSKIIYDKYMFSSIQESD